VRIADCVFGNSITSGESARKACHYADRVPVVTAYKFCYPTVSGALITSGKEAAMV
jgi:hypothetical protein